MATRRRRLFDALLVLATTPACADHGVQSGFDVADAGGTSTAAGDPATSDTLATEASTSGGGESAEPKFDLASADGGAPDPACGVAGDLDAPGACSERAPPDSFEPVVEWTWADPEVTQVFATPLVANLTDDDGNGSIDLCDVPDVVVVGALDDYHIHGARLWVLDGATGDEHFRIPDAVAAGSTPALGDIDGDGRVEIVAAIPTTEDTTHGPTRVVAFSHDGELKWESDVVVGAGVGSPYGIALADLDADGDVEIVTWKTVLDHEGKHLWSAPMLDGHERVRAAAIADLDGDGRSEVIFDTAAYTADGAPYYELPELGEFETGYSQVANLDDDPEPEVLVTTPLGVTVVEHDGTIKVLMARPTEEVYPQWDSPATIHDFDGDQSSDVALVSHSRYTVARGDLTQIWAIPADVANYGSSGTAFDFLGDGVAEAVLRDRNRLVVHDGGAAPLMEVATGEGDYTGAYPIVVDVDNDGSAEILVTSSHGDGAQPALQVIGDVDDRWVQARRIWNQHTYHVTNVREDGTIPQHEPPSWSTVGTYRTNAQIEGGAVCKPEPAG